VDEKNHRLADTPKSLNNSTTTMNITSSNSTPVGQSTMTTSLTPELSINTSAAHFPGGAETDTTFDETDSMMSDMLASFGSD
jgi:hypothetical protein